MGSLVRFTSPNVRGKHKRSSGFITQRNPMPRRTKKQGIRYPLERLKRILGEAFSPKVKKRNTNDLNQILRFCVPWPMCWWQWFRFLSNTDGEEHIVETNRNILGDCKTFRSSINHD